jgi:iron-sulfur cluster repair protein YtfE (RIC family)
VEYKLDMSMMFAYHDALRRDLDRVGRLATRLDGDPAKLLRAAVGWGLFKKFLVNHHESEDEALWPALRAAVAANSDQVALVDALEQEHAVIDPLLAAVDAAAADPDGGHERFGGVVDQLIIELTAHLTHEERDGLPLIDVSLTAGEWRHFISVNSERNRPDAAMYMPWLLSEATPPTTAAVLGKFPPPLVTAFRAEWAPAYAALDVWKGL